MMLKAGSEVGVVIFIVVMCIIQAADWLIKEVRKKNKAAGDRGDGRVQGRPKEQDEPLELENGRPPAESLDPEELIVAKMRELFNPKSARPMETSAKAPASRWQPPSPPRSEPVLTPAPAVPSAFQPAPPRPAPLPTLQMPPPPPRPRTDSTSVGVIKAQQAQQAKRKAVTAKSQARGRAGAAGAPGVFWTPAQARQAFIAHEIFGAPRARQPLKRS